MSQFELLRNVTVGQYIPTGSFIHRLDPRTKLIASLLFILAVSFSRALLPCALLVLTCLLIAWAARISIRYVLRGVVLGLPILLFVFAIQFIFQGWAEPAGRVFFEWGWFRVTRFSLQLISIGIMRILCFIFYTSLITMTTTVTELTHGFEKLLDPFRRFGLPSHELALINMIALRFVPTFAEEMEQVMKAQASRCGDIGANRKFWRPDKAARAYLPLIIPLFINAFRRAEDLILAMEARGYIGGDSRTKFVLLQAGPQDYQALAVAVLFFVVIVFSPWPALRDILALLGLGGGL
jgi:energy-coupling factor transport system permease protein